MAPPHNTETPTLGPWPHPVPPLGWDEHPLTSELDAAHANARGYFELRPASLARLTAVQEALWTATHFHTAVVRHTEVVLLSHRAGTQFQSAVSALMQLRLFDVAIGVRSVLECAGYALLFMERPEIATAWARRGADRALVRRLLTARLMCDTVVQQCRISGTEFKSVYERSIDWGAHPNVEGVGASTLVRSDTATRSLAMGAPPFNNNTATVAQHETLLERAGISALEAIARALQPYRHPVPSLEFVKSYFAGTGPFAPPADSGDAGC